VKSLKDEMAKLRLYCCLITLTGLLCATNGYSQYQLKIFPVDKDSAFLQKNFALQTSFKSRGACLEYVYDLPALLQSKGYLTTSIDSIKSDSAQASVHLYTGDIYKWVHINTKNIDPEILSNSNWSEKNFSNKPLNFQQFQNSQQQMLNYFENNGYPFAKISLDSIIITNGDLTANLKIDKGPLYKIDSIRVYGAGKISSDFLQHYLNIPNGSLYRKEKLQAISKKLRELPYVVEQQPWNITLLGTGSVINLYLKPKKSSQIDALVGFLPSNNAATASKLLVTGQATINLKNSFGNGESIGLDWQQVQQKSPRLDISFLQPYLFKSPFGINFDFNLFKKDSSYLNISAILGVQYAASATQTSTVFIQTMSSTLLNVDTQLVIATHHLPDSIADVSSFSFGLNYEFNNTNYRFNPQRGNEFQFTGTIGTRKIKKNSVITQLIDPSDSGFSFNSLYDSIKLNSYQFRVKVIAAHYFQFGWASTLKLGFNVGVYQSPNSFLNELFQIGGYKLLRGFDEESIYASQYGVGTFEYRYLIGQNSFLFSFLDLGWAKNNIPGYNLNNTYLGVGLGMAFETKAGIFNISYAVGKRDDTDLSLREAKIHLGYVNFF
jgi:outer membrane protein assembly factor BamA